MVTVITLDTEGDIVERDKALIQLTLQVSFSHSDRIKEFHVALKEYKRKEIFLIGVNCENNILHSSMSENSLELLKILE